MATFAFFIPTRLASFIPQAFSRDHFFVLYKDSRGLEQVGSQQPVSPSRDPAIRVDLTGLMTPWRLAKIGAYS